jgi:hypothetical protein
MTTACAARLQSELSWIGAVRGALLELVQPKHPAAV